jgi:hypothetical protein
LLDLLQYYPLAQGKWMSVGMGWAWIEIVEPTVDVSSEVAFLIVACLFSAVHE